MIHFVCPYVCLSVLAGFVGYTLCTTSTVEDYAAHHRPALCTADLHCAPIPLKILRGQNGKTPWYCYISWCVRPIAISFRVKTRVSEWLWRLKKRQDTNISDYNSYLENQFTWVRLVLSKWKVRTSPLPHLEMLILIRVESLHSFLHAFSITFSTCYIMLFSSKRVEYLTPGIAYGEKCIFLVLHVLHGPSFVLPNTSSTTSLYFLILFKF